jgi:hypothetical protein
LNTDENFSHYDFPIGVIQKVECATNIVHYILGKGVNIEHAVDQITSKIEWLEPAMRPVYDFSRLQTGKGIKENERYKNFQKRWRLLFVE